MLNSQHHINYADRTSSTMCGPPHNENKEPLAEKFSIPRWRQSSTEIKCRTLASVGPLTICQPLALALPTGRKRTMGCQIIITNDKPELSIRRGKHVRKRKYQTALAHSLWLHGQGRACVRRHELRLLRKESFHVTSTS